MAYKYVTQRFNGGMNQDMDPVVIDMLSQDPSVIETVSTATNLLFERGLMITRPCVVTPLGGNPGSFISGAYTVVAADQYGLSQNNNISNRGAVALVKDNAGAPRLFILSTDQTIGPLFTPTEITGAGMTGMLTPQPFSSTEINGVVLFGGISDGIIRWDPTTTNYTILSVAYKFVAKQFARALAAYTVGAFTNTGPLTIAFSVSGDETNWSGYGSGLDILPDVSDVITGLGVIKGVVVVPRSFGFHLGFPTGQFPTIYNWTLFNEESIGCYYPASMAWAYDRCYFMSQFGIHSFDLTTFTDIGEGVYEECAFLMSEYGLTPRGFIISTYRGDFRPSYNITFDSFPNVFGPGTLPTIPHFMYDIRERKWSRHVYAPVNPTKTEYTDLIFPFNCFLTPAFAGTSFQQQTIAILPRAQTVQQTFLQWNNALSYPQVDTSCFFTTGKISISPPYFEAVLNRVLIVYKTTTANDPSFSMTVSSVLNGNETDTVNNFLSNTNGKWTRQWVNIRQPGNQFQIMLAFGNDAGVFLREVVMEFTDQAKERN